MQLQTLFTFVMLAAAVAAHPAPLSPVDGRFNPRPGTPPTREYSTTLARALKPIEPQYSHQRGSYQVSVNKPRAGSGAHLAEAGVKPVLQRSYNIAHLLGALKHQRRPRRVPVQDYSKPGAEDGTSTPQTPASTSAPASAPAPTDSTPNPAGDLKKRCTIPVAGKRHEVEVEASCKGDQGRQE